MKKSAVLFLLALLIPALLAGCGCGGGDNPPVLISLEVSPANPVIAAGMTQQFKATGVFSDSSTQDMTGSVSWGITDETVASISNDVPTRGLALSLSPGTVTVTAASGGVSGSTTLTVTAATLVSIQVVPQNPALATGTTEQFSAIGTFTDNSTKDITSQAAWSSSDAAVASVSNDSPTKGSALAVSAGSAVITASIEGVSGATTITVTGAALVSLDITPKDQTVVKGTTRQFKATGTFSDNSTQDLTTAVAWSSSDNSVATISNDQGAQGLANTLSGGTISIKATFGNISAQTTLTVTTAALVSIRVEPLNPVGHFATTIQFKATGIYSDGSSADITNVVTWNSSDTSIATISNAPGTKGLATTDHKIGATTITATLGSVSGSTRLLDP